jgi:hypothetical protein
LVSLYFPAAEVGLPKGCENGDLIPSMSLVYNFYNAMKSFREQVSRYIREQAPQVSCIIGGMCCVWAADVAQELGVLINNSETNLITQTLLRKHSFHPDFIDMKRRITEGLQ